jgi:hypothetical protein
MLVALFVLLAAVCLVAAATRSPEAGRQGWIPEMPPTVLRIVAGSFGPTALALLLALVSLPLIALSLDVVAYQPGLPLGTQGNEVSLVDLGRWSGAAGAVFGSALVAGTVGGLALRRNAVIGGLVAFVLAWMVSIAALSLLPALLNLNVGFSYFCLDSCGPALSSSNPTDGFFLAIMPWALMMSIFMAPVAFITLGVGVVAWTRLLRRVSARTAEHPERQPTQAEAPRAHLS